MDTQGESHALCGRCSPVCRAYVAALCLTRMRCPFSGNSPARRLCDSMSGSRLADCSAPAGCELRSPLGYRTRSSIGESGEDGDDMVDRGIERSRNTLQRTGSPAVTLRCFLLTHCTGKVDESAGRRDSREPASGRRSVECKVSAIDRIFLATLSRVETLWPFVSIPLSVGYPLPRLVARCLLVALPPLNTFIFAALAFVTH